MAPAGLPDSRPRRGRLDAPSTLDPVLFQYDLDCRPREPDDALVPEHRVHRFSEKGLCLGVGGIAATPCDSRRVLLVLRCHLHVHVRVGVLAHDGRIRGDRGRAVLRVNPPMHVPVSRDLGDDTRRADDLEQRVGLGTDCECYRRKYGREAGLPLRRGAQGVDVTLRVSPTIAVRNAETVRVRRNLPL